MGEDDFRAANRANWNDRARLHASDPTGMYRLDTVLAGRSCLHPIEAGEIGDVAGQSIAHLQCHIGTDTLSLAHLGAAVVGLDFSPVAIAAARDLAARAGRADVRFVEADVHDAPAVLGGGFDRVFVTWGAINWLPDIARWARVVAAVLRPGGRLYLAETHPVTLCLEEIDGVIRPAYDRRTPKDRPLAFDETTTYTGDARPIASSRSYEWIHPLADILTGLADAGLALERFAEHDALPYRLFPCMVPADRDEAGRPVTYRLPDGHPRLPLAFSLSAARTA